GQAAPAAALPEVPHPGGNQPPRPPRERGGCPGPGAAAAADRPAGTLDPSGDARGHAGERHDPRRGPRPPRQLTWPPRWTRVGTHITADTQGWVRACAHNGARGPRTVPGRAGGFLLPDAGLVPRGRGSGAGDDAAGVEGAPALRPRPGVRADLAVPDRDQ